MSIKVSIFAKLIYINWLYIQFNITMKKWSLLMIILYLPNVYKNNEALSFLTSWLYQCGNFQYIIYFATVLTDSSLPSYNYH